MEQCFEFNELRKKWNIELNPKKWDKLSSSLRAPTLLQVRVDIVHWTTNCRQVTIKVIASDWEHSTMVKLAIELYWPSEHLCYPSSDTTEPIWTASIANRQQRTPKYIVQTYEFHEVKSRATYYGSMLELEECFLGVYSTLETCRPSTCEQQWSNAFNT